MDTTIAVDQQPKKRGRGRPRKEDVEARQREEVLNQIRPKRQSIRDTRDILSVEGKDPNFEYRWVLDQNENGQRIYRFQRAGWELVSKEENLEIGEASVFKSEGHGSIYRVPAGGSQYLYLLKIAKEFYEEDQARKHREIDELERTMIDREMSQEGRYGRIEIS